MGGADYLRSPLSLPAPQVKDINQKQKKCLNHQHQLSLTSSYYLRSFLVHLDILWDLLDGVFGRDKPLLLPPLNFCINIA